jgi:hypothetical protein
MTRLDDLITCQDAAIELGFTADYIRKMCSERKIAATKKGNTWIMHRSSIKSIVRQRKKPES